MFVTQATDHGENDMIKTVTVGEYQSIQGWFVRNLPDGKVVVRVGQKLFSGLPVDNPTAVS